MNKTFTAALLAALTLTGASAGAQSLSRMFADTGLTPEDFTILADTARGLYDTANPQLGKKVTWTNEASGSRGTVRLAAMRAGCAYIQHFVYAKGASEPREIRSRRCRDADGNWLLSP